MFVQMLMETIKIFSDSTGLVINPKKSRVYYGGIDKSTKDQIIGATELTKGQLPMRYLGVPITSKRLSINHYMPLVDKITQRMKHWTSKLLSYAGRVLLVKSIVLAIT